MQENLNNSNYGNDEPLKRTSYGKNPISAKKLTSQREIDTEIMRFNNNKNFEKFQENI